MSPFSILDFYTANSIEVISDNSQMYNMSGKRMMGIIIVLNNINTIFITQNYIYIPKRLLMY